MYNWLYMPHNSQHSPQKGAEAYAVKTNLALKT